MTETLAASPLAQAIGLALVEFVWQGAVIGIATALMLAALRRSTADARYIVSCLGLLVMALAPIVTTMYHARWAITPSNDAVATPLTDADAKALSETASASGDLLTPDTTSVAQAVPLSMSSRLGPWLPTIVVFWIGGVAALSLNLIRGWIQARRLLRHATSMSASVWPARMRLMADRLGLQMKIRLVKSALVDVPAVIGWLRPAIVVPMSVLAGLPPAHLDAILAHELSHIRRRDYLVNIVQCVVETMLFYHPAVWWVSRRIRVERENCCDDLAASLCDSRLTYATALASLETLRAATPAIVMPATGGVLLHRIRRLVDPRCPSIPEFSGGFAMCVIATLLLLVSQLTASPPQQAATVEPAVVVSPSPASAPGVPTVVVVDRQQATQGSIEGTVTDQSGGVIPGASVMLTSAVSAAKRSATTDARGRFVFAEVTSGAYDVTVSIMGFKSWRARVQLATGQRAAMEVRLEIGSLTETVVLQGTQPPAGGRGAQGAAPRNAMAHLEAARQYYQQGRLADAEAMTAQALQLLRAEMSQRMFPMAEPRATTAAAGEPKPGVVNAVRVGGSIREPRKTRHVNPIYPAEAQAAAIQGYVIIEAVIGTDGAVKEARVIGGEPILADAALTAVRQWEYTPTLLNGVPVDVIMNVTVHFKLGGM